MLVSDICTKSLISVESSTECIGAARLMVKHGIHSLVVVNNNQPQGIITKSDLVKRVMLNKASNAEKQPVGDFMTKSLLVVQEDASVMDACGTMVEFGVRHLLVIKKQVNQTISRLAKANQFDMEAETQILPPMVGILSIVDIIRNIPKILLS